MRKRNRKTSPRNRKARSAARTTKSAKELLRSAGLSTPSPSIPFTEFSAEALLHRKEMGGKVVNVPKNTTLFTQGDVADTVYYVLEGRVKVGVVSQQGKEAIITVLGAGEFVGEDCIATSHLSRLITARTLAATRLLRFEREKIAAALRRDRAFSDAFVAFLLKRNVRTQADLIDQLFNSSEKRLARVLLLLSQFGKEGKSETVVPNLSQESLAEMIGTTRSRVSFFMNRFRKLGFIDYNGGIKVNSSLLSVVLRD